MRPDLFDWPLVFEVVAGLPQLRFVFLGSLATAAAEEDGWLARDFAAKLADLPNVRIVSDLPYEQTAYYLAGADVGMVPFAVNDVTTFSSPLKVFEYLAAGLPVISTPLQNLVGVPGVTVWDSVAQWRHAILSALQNQRSPQAVAERLAYARRATWSARAAAFQAVVSEHRWN